MLKLGLPGVDEPSMVYVDGLRLRLRLLVRGEQGMALPVALFSMLAATALASAAVMSSVDVQQGSHRDDATKKAIAAADAGANVALMRANRYASALSSSPSSNCLGSSGGVLVVTGAAVDGWCPAIEGSVGGATYSYRVSAVASGAAPIVVSTGSAAGVSRRIKIAFNKTSVGSILNDAAVISEEDLNLYNSAEIAAGAGTNGNAFLYNSATICGDIRHGIGNKVEFFNSAGQCNPYGQTEGEETPPPVSSIMPIDIATNNSDLRLEKCSPWHEHNENPPGCELDGYTSNNKFTWGWVPGTSGHPGRIELNNTSTLTLGGGDYFICKLSINNSSTLYMAAGANVRIFFDTPENCGLGSGSAQVELNNNTHIESTGFGTEGDYSVPGLYLQGSTSRVTTVSLNNKSGSNQFDIYAPNSNIIFNNNASFEGSVVGKRVTLYNSATVEQDDGYEPPDIGGSTLYTRQSYVECSGLATAVPDEDC